MLTPEIKQLLSQSKPLHYLAKDELDRLLAFAPIKGFAQGKVIQKQGGISPGIYVLLEGQAVVTTRILGKELITLTMLDVGDFIGELLGNKPSTTTVVAASKVKGVLITKDYFNMLGNFFPETKFKISKAITEFICQRLRRIHKKITAIINQSEINVYPAFSSLFKYFLTANQVTLKESGFEKKQIQDLFSGLFSDSEFNELFAYSKIIKLAKNHTIIKKGEIQKSFYVVLRGAVQLSILNENKMAKLTVLGPGSVICSLAFIDNKPAILTYSTCEQAILLKMEEKQIALLKEKNILLWYKIYDLICQSLVNREEPTDRLFLRLNSEIYNE